MSDVRVKGLAELQKAMQSLPAQIEANIMRGAMRAGAKVIAADAKQNINHISGDLGKSVRFGAKLDRAAGGVMAYIRAGGKGTSGWYAHMVEKGTVAHWIKVRDEDRPGRMTRRGFRKYSIGTLNKMAKRGSLVIGGNFIGASVEHPGAKAHPFMRPALDTKAQSAIVAVADYIRKRLASKHGLNIPAPMDTEAVE